MATRRSDIIIPEIFTGYVEEQTTNQDKFLQSGVVAPLAALNASEDGGDFVNIPNIKANLTGDFEVMSDSTSLTPGKVSADKQIGVVLHRARASRHAILPPWQQAPTCKPQSATSWVLTSRTKSRKISSPACKVLSVH